MLLLWILMMPSVSWRAPVPPAGKHPTVWCSCPVFHIWDGVLQRAGSPSFLQTKLWSLWPHSSVLFHQTRNSLAFSGGFVAVASSLLRSLSGYVNTVLWIIDAVVPFSSSIFTRSFAFARFHTKVPNWLVEGYSFWFGSILFNSNPVSCPPVESETAETQQFKLLIATKKERGEIKGFKAVFLAVYMVSVFILPASQSFPSVGPLFCALVHGNSTSASVTENKTRDPAPPCLCSSPTGNLCLLIAEE